MAKDLAQAITDTVIAELEQGRVPWRRPWSVNGLVPTSLQTGKAYRGVNALLLTLYAAAYGYDRNLWITYRQAQAMGGNVRKGEKAVDVIFWKKVDGKKDEATGEKTRGFMIMKSFAVFNVAQCDGLVIPEKFEAPKHNWQGSDAVERIVNGYPNAPKIIHAAQGRAYYEPAADTVTLPPRESFPTPADYAETLFHELTHSTGHADRLNRFNDTEQPAVFGNEPYAREELVAELGAMMLLTMAGIEPDTKNSASYIGGWLTKLGNDKNLIVQAAQRASKAVEWITDPTEDEDGEE